jgi:uncharacterized protein (TIGR00730 family)
MKRVCVFCGSSGGARGEYMAAARSLGRLLACEGLETVYGGGKIGLMGEVARSAMEAGGHVIGVIPANLEERELGFKELPDLRVVGSMHERKALMSELADAFIALPGGVGTIEEFFEALTWTQLGFHKKPCGLLNVEGYYDKLLAFMDHVCEEKFVEQEDREMILEDSSPEGLLERLRNFQPSGKDKAKWVLDQERRRIRSS